jgi:hypothetical protein
MLIALIFALAIAIIVMLTGCCSNGHPTDGWSISLVNVSIQLGGSRTDPTITTRNTLGTNAIQTHTLPVEASQTAGATSLSVPVGE